MKFLDKLPGRHDRTLQGKVAVSDAVRREDDLPACAHGMQKMSEQPHRPGYSGSNGAPRAARGDRDHGLAYLLSAMSIVTANSATAYGEYAGTLTTEMPTCPARGEEPVVSVGRGCCSAIKARVIHASRIAYEL